MPIYNVTPTTFDHLCHSEDRTCLKAQQAIPHSALEVMRRRFGRVTITFRSCEDHVAEHPKDDEGNELCGAYHGCTIHFESFGTDFGPEDEIAETRDEASREQVRNIRLLMQHLGLPRKEERTPPRPTPSE